MGFRTMLGGSFGRRFAGVLAVTAIVAFAAQGAIGAPSDKKPKEARQGAGQQGAGKQQAPAPAPDQKQVTRMVGGVQVKVDPKTGRLVPPTAEEAQKLAEALQNILSREVENLVPVQREDGSIYIDLEEGFQEAVMASVSPKGRVAVRCVNDKAQAARILAGEPINDGAAEVSRVEAKRSGAKGRTAPAEKE